MTQEPRNFLNHTDEQIAHDALVLGGYHFQDLCGGELLNGDDLFVEVGAIVDGEYVRWGAMPYGDPDKAAEYAVNVSADGGKLETVVRYEMDSTAAFRLHGNEVGDGPRQWPGGVFLEACVQLPDGTWRTCKFATAASGVQSAYDATIARGVASDVAAMWAERELARFAANTSTVDVTPASADA